MDPNKTLKPDTATAQIVVIGGGAAGLSAAVAMAEEGADVILLEKHRKLGGNSAMAFGPFAAESPAQKRALVDARKEDLFRMHMDFNQWQLNPRLVRAIIDKSGDTIRWLEEKGMTFNLILHRPNQVPLTHHLSKGRGREIIDLLANNFEKLGGRLICETRAKQVLIRDGKDALGVVATTKDGKELRINASSVIIATGGYAGNKELLRKYHPYYKDNMLCAGFPNMGDGLSMALEIGAATEGLGLLQMAIGNVPGAGTKLRVVSCEPYTIWINKKGERFMDEAFCYEHSRQEAAFGILCQPDSMYFSLFDERLVRRIMKDGLVLGGHYSDETWSGAKMPDLPNLLQSGPEESIKISDSWDEIARWIGVIPEVLKTTIDEYNSSCDHGYDIFAKDRRFLTALRTPPYYALRCTLHFNVTMGGIKINHHMEVLDKEDRPIPGVYAAGIDAGGWVGKVYNARLSGFGLAFPLSSGRIAGENAVKYISEK